MNRIVFFTLILFSVNFLAFGQGQLLKERTGFVSGDRIVLQKVKSNQAANSSGKLAKDIETANILFDNGPIVTNPGAGVGGADFSMLEAPNTNFGFRISSGFAVADDFVINGVSNWAIDSVVFYGYQTGSTVNSTFTSYYVRVWIGMPGQAGSNVVWGDTVTNVLSQTSFSNIYRGSDSSNTQRPVMQNVCITNGLTLNTGLYWIEWQAAGTLASGPWTPPVTISGMFATGNALQKSGANYVAVEDGSNPQGLPFVVYGTAGPALQIDGGVTEIKNLAESCDAVSTNISVTITNFGSFPISNFHVGYNINGGASIIETCMQTIAPGACADYTFPNPAQVNEGISTINAFTQITNDAYLQNDSSSIIFESISHSAVPYFCNFETEESRLEWAVEDVNNDNITWAAYDNFGTNNSVAAGCSYSSTNVADDWMFSRCIYLNEGTSYALSFGFRARSEDYPENLEVKIGTAQTVAAMITPIVNLQGIVNTVYENSFSSFSVPVSGTYIIGFHCYSDADMWAVYVDDVAVDIANNADLVDLNSNVGIYPNPVSEILNITNVANKQVCIYNILGEKVYSKFCNENNKTIDITSFVNGSYIVKICSDKATITKKINIIK
jgi:hypothetical protein